MDTDYPCMLMENIIQLKEYRGPNRASDSNCKSLSQPKLKGRKLMSDDAKLEDFKGYISLSDRFKINFTN